MINMHKTIKFNLNPNDQYIKKVGQIFNKFLNLHGISDDLANRQVTIIRELIKLGKFYGCLTPYGKKGTVCVHISEDTIMIEISHPVDHTCCERLKKLDTTIQFIRGFQDPFEAYRLKQKEASKDYSDGMYSVLGLARIVYKENAILDFFISKDNELFLSAACNIETNF